MLSKLWSRLSSRERRDSGITFTVDDVSPVVKPIWSESLAASLGQRFARKIFLLPEPDRQVIDPVFDSLSDELRAKFSALPVNRRPVSRCHPLIQAVHTAFSQHRPLTLTPDALWLAITQGFSHHVAAHAEALRGRLVRHQGRQALTATLNELTLAEFEHGIASLSAQIGEATDPVLHETLICDFSTTTPAIRTVSEVVLMDSFSSYFDYYMRCVCGIPSITLEGSLADWQRIRARVEVIDTYGLGWWVSRLRPILDEIVSTAGGHPAREFWKAIYKPEKAYGDEVVTGWIADLFPYLCDAPRRVRNHVFEHERHDWALPVDQGVETKSRFFGPRSGKGVRLKSFPSGLSSVPVKLQFKAKPDCDVDLVAGFLAVKQDPSGAVSPVISWSVTEPPPKKPVMI